MKLSKFKEIVAGLSDLHFTLPSGEAVPAHYHVTEVGSIQRDFIDCGGTVRSEKTVNFQLWYSTDEDHLLKPEKLLKIIALSETTLGIVDGEIEVEYQSDTIGRYGLLFNGKSFDLVAKQTDCLAKDNCGIPVVKKKRTMAELPLVKDSTCTPGGGCC